MTAPLILKNTVEALRRYDEADARWKAEHHRWTAEQELRALAELDRLGEAVGAAFGEDTKDRNNPETCQLTVRPDPWLRSLVATYLTLHPEEKR